MKRLKMRDDDRSHDVDWPDIDRRQGLQLYGGRRPFRKIRVMVDNELLDATPVGQAPATERQLLTELLVHELVRLIKYADDGPPPAALGKDGWATDWAIVEPTTVPNMSWAVKISTTPDSQARASIFGNWPDAAEADHRSPAYSHLPAEEAARRRRTDAIAAQVAAQAVGADIYVTERPYLHAVTWELARGVVICSPLEALAVLGLYFRTQGVFPVAQRYSFNRGLFYWVGMRELLPEAWRWFGSCVNHSLKTKDHGLMVLSGSLLQRVDRALETRDEIHLALNQPQDHDTQESALSNLDVVLILLMAAVDVAARVAHRILGLSAEEYRAAWQSSKWRDQVRSSAPNLAAVVDTGSRGEAVLSILRLLRNSVHGTALQGMAFQSELRSRENFVVLPEADREDVRLAMEKLGGLGVWGLGTPWRDRLHLDAAVFADRLMIEVVAFLNDLMRETPVERLPNADLKDADKAPPAGKPGRDITDEYAPWIRRSIRWQLGL